MFKSFHFKLEYHVCLTCLHLNQYFAFALQEPAIVKRRRGCPGGSTNRINNPTQRELSAFERNTGCTTRARAVRSRGAIGRVVDNPNQLQSIIIPGRLYNLI